MRKFFPYQIVELKEPVDIGPDVVVGYVELMSFPHEGTVFARTVIGDPTSAVYIEEARLGKVVSLANCAICKFKVPRATVETVKRGDLFVTVCKSHQLVAK